MHKLSINNDNVNSKPIIVDSNESLEALCTNRDRTRVAVVGRTVAKVYALYENRLEFRSERSKPRTAMYFSGSIAWSPLKENLVAAASSNGCIFLWDPESSYSIERAYKAHKQLATKVCFNEFNENLMLSGSKDSTVWLYDLRSPEPSTCFASNCDDSIRDIQFCIESKLQDTFVTAGDSGTIRFWDARRPDRAMKEFIAHSSQVYSVALNPQPQSKNLIATAGRDKYIRIWDWSKNTPHFIYTVETMAIVTRVSWCPNNSWHVACCFASPSGFAYSDNIVYVWDIRRPFIPYASFDVHTKTCTDISWSRFGRGDHFLSCGKDGKLVVNFASSAHHPILYANSVALDANSPFDEIAIAVPSDLRKSSSVVDPFRRKVPSTLFCALPSDPFLMSTRAMAYFAENYKIVGGTVEQLCEHNAKVAECLFRDRLAYTWRMVALLYSQTQLSTFHSQFSSVAKTSKKNVGSGTAAVDHLHHFRRSLSSNFLLGNADHQKSSFHRYTHRNRILYASGNSDGRTVAIPQLDRYFSSSIVPGLGPVSASPSAVPHQQHGESGGFGASSLFFGADELNLGGLMDFGFDDQRLEKCAATHSISLRSIICSSIVDLSQLREEAFTLHSHGTWVNRRQKLTSDGMTTVETLRSRQKQRNRKRQNLSRRKQRNVNYFFGSDAKLPKKRLDKNNELTITHRNDGEKDEGMVSNSSENCSFASSMPPFSSSSTLDSDESQEDRLKDGEEDEAEDESECSSDDQLSESDLSDRMAPASSKTLQKCSSGALLFFDPTPSLKALFDHCSAMGDVQMSATICMIMGERVVESGLASTAQTELWLLSYIELLERLCLWRVAALFVKFCSRPKISQLSNESTFMKVWCIHCKNVAFRASSRCKSCQRLHDYNCSICETRVRGLWTTCSGCGHGGHLEHFREWFAQWDQCPVPGCGHQCVVIDCKARIHNQQLKHCQRNPRSPMTNI